MLFSVETLGKSIISLRHAKETSQEQLALKSNMSVSYLRDIEHGCANPSIDTLTRIANTLDVTLPLLIIYSLNDEEVQDLLRNIKEISELTV